MPPPSATAQARAYHHPETDVQVRADRWRAAAADPRARLQPEARITLSQKLVTIHSQLNEKVYEIARIYNTRFNSHARRPARVTVKPCGTLQTGFYFSRLHRCA